MFNLVNKIKILITMNTYRDSQVRCNLIFKKLHQTEKIEQFEAKKTPARYTYVVQ